MRILQVNTQDIQGGAAQVAWNLHRQYKARGHESRMAVGRKQSGDGDVIEIPKIPAGTAANPLRRALLSAARRLQPAGRLRWRRASRWCAMLAAPPAFGDFAAGYHELYSPGSRELEQLLPEQPDVIHCHNLHGDYFDLRLLPALSRRRPVFLTLHDAWLSTGHCAHSLGCERWRAGCGHCPDLTLYPSMKRDLTAHAWQAKRAALAGARLHVAAPSRWLLDRVSASLLAPAMVAARVIPNGVDTAVFRPGDRRAARELLGLAPDDRVVLFVADGIRNNPYKDFTTLRRAFERVVAQTSPDMPLRFVALGEAGPTERIGHAELRFTPYCADRGQTARHFQAADVYAHAARAETFPNTILEALACGVPVVATGVGGIPEQIRSLGGTGAGSGDWNGREATGLVTPAGDPDALATAILRILGDGPTRLRLGENAARDAASRFALDRQAGAYLAWYQEACAGHGALRESAWDMEAVR